MALRQQRRQKRARTLPAAVSSWACPAPPLGVIPDLADEAFVPLDSALDNDIHEKVQKALDVAARQLAAAGALFDQQHQLLEGKLGTGRVNTGDGAGMTRIHITEIVKCLFGTQLRK